MTLRILIVFCLVFTFSFGASAQETQRDDTKTIIDTTDPKAHLYPERIPHPRDDDKLLGMRLWVVETIPQDRDIIEATMEKHIRYQLMLEREGIMFAAGPIYGADANKPDGNGLIIIRADNVKDARAVADADPMHLSGGRTYRLRQWRVNEGSFTVTIPFSRYHPPKIE